MPWIVLVVSALLEAVWATALGASDGFRELAPSLIFGAALIASMISLAYVTKYIPISTAYAVWAGLGAALTVGWSMITGAEAVTAARLALIAGVVGSVVGLKLIRKTTDLPSASSS